MNEMNRWKLMTGILGTAVLLAMLLVVRPVRSSGALPIDDFDEGATDVHFDIVVEPNPRCDTSSDGFLGGYRHVCAKLYAGDDLRARVRPDVGEFHLTAGAATEAITEITWNGSAVITYSNPSEYNLGGSNGVIDLTDGGDVAGIYVRLIKADLAADQGAIMSVIGYTDATNYSALSQKIGPQFQGDLVLFFPFDAFVQEGSEGPADWTDIGALVLKIDGSKEAGTDVIISLVEGREELADYGDLPDGPEEHLDYSDVLDGCHVIWGPTLGTRRDAEPEAIPSIDALGDDLDNIDDEDGVVPENDFYAVVDNAAVYEWSARVTVSNCVGDCYLNGWIDFDGLAGYREGGSFSGTYDHFINDEPVPNGQHKFVIGRTGPDDLLKDKGYYYLRFRICDEENECNQPRNVEAGQCAPNGEVEDYRWYLEPTAVQLSGFRATWQRDVIEVAWETALEIDTVGFNVWRSTAEDGDYVQVNEALIPSASPGAISGGSYGLVDGDVTPFTTYYYKLEELEVGGRRNWYGPAVAEAPLTRPRRLPIEVPILPPRPGPRLPVVDQ